MKRIARSLAGLGIVVAPLVSAGDGLSVPEGAWTRWQARLTVLAAEPHPTRALLGEYRLGPPLRAGIATWQGGLRATGGVVLGRAAAAVAAPDAVHGLADQDDSMRPYLGLGYSGGSERSGWSVNADFGLVAEQPRGIAGLGRAVLGRRSLDDAVREIRLSPLLQLGVRYSF